MIKLPPEITKDLNYIDAVADDLQMKLYVVGGFPRDLVMGTGITDETDLDVTEAHGNAFDLAFFVSAKYNLMEPTVYESSGTAFVKMPSGRDVEFHNAFFNVPHIIDQLYSMGVEPTPLNKDIYSRDFTINTLLFDPDTGKIIDLTGRGVSDIENRILMTPLEPRKSLSINPKNILRGIRFVVQFGLTIDEDYEREIPRFLPYLIQFLKENPDSTMVQRTVKKTMESNREKAMELYERYGLLEHLPPSIDIQQEIKEEIFGTTISPVASIKEAQTPMMNRLIKEREKHKAYMRRKKREQTDKSKKKFKILERARTGYYLDNPEPDFVNQRKVDKSNKILNYVRDKSAAKKDTGWFRIAQEGLEATDYGMPTQMVQDTSEMLEGIEEVQEEGQATSSQNDLMLFIEEFSSENGINEDQAQQTYVYISSPGFLSDAGEIGYDAENISNNLVMPQKTLPLENQTAINNLQEVERVFGRNRQLMDRMLRFVDSNGNTWQSFISPSMDREAPVE